ncbi:hypothetical protein T4B_12990 [Trichinella pseudospiralis]|uniref:Uncharacterized protein n=1 Tax=Trichinella pseudospiralis TaxID=6337 RepID=A0A0V1IM13_TRIPS|nr:hypothetical protein T4B_12990 [Trichinella pseudospiralis]
MVRSFRRHKRQDVPHYFPVLQVRHILRREILEYQNQCNFDQHIRNILYETNGKQRLPCLNKHFDIFPLTSIVSEKQQYSSHLSNFPFLHDAVQC